MIDEINNWEVRSQLAFKTTSIINSIVKKDKKRFKRFIEVMLQFYNSKTYQWLYKELLNSKDPSEVDFRPFKKRFIDELENSSELIDSTSYQINSELLDEMIKKMKMNKKAGYYTPDYTNLPRWIESYGCDKELSALEVIFLVKNDEYKNKFIEAEVRSWLAFYVQEIVEFVIGEDKKRFIEVMIRFYNSATYQSLYHLLHDLALTFHSWDLKESYRKIDYLSFKKMFMDEVESTPEYIDPIPYPIDCELLDKEESFDKTRCKADFVYMIPSFITKYAVTKGLSDQEAILLLKKYDVLNHLINLSAYLGMTGDSIETIDRKIEHQDPNFHLENVNDFVSFQNGLREIFLILSSILI